jgi:hypothetical protein
VALIAKYVRFPPGRWIRFADARVWPWLAEEMAGDMFPLVRDNRVIFAVLMTEFDVKEFEAGAYQTG